MSPHPVASKWRTVAGCVTSPTISSTAKDDHAHSCTACGSSSANWYPIHHYDARAGQTARNLPSLASSALHSRRTMQPSSSLQVQTWSGKDGMHCPSSSYLLLTLVMRRCTARFQCGTVPEPPPSKKKKIDQLIIDTSVTVMDRDGRPMRPGPEA